MSNLIRNQLPLTIISIILIVIFTDYFLALPPSISNFVSGLQQWIVILAAFALVLGAFNIVKIHLPKIRKSKEISNKLLSAWLLVIMTITIIFGLTLGTTSSPYTFIFSNMLSPISTSVWSIMAFYFCGAVIRTFRPRNLESIVLIISTFLVASGNAPAVTPYLPWYENIKTWIMDVPNVSGMRGMIIATGIGVLFTGVKMLFQVERRSTVGVGE